MLVKQEKLLDCRNKKQKLLILGSTGSIGCSALKLIDLHPNSFEIYALTAGSNVKLLAEQAIKYQPRFIACVDESKYQELKLNLNGKFRGEILTGSAAIAELAKDPEVELVLAAIVGVAGLLPVYEALLANKTVALANKESLVSAGEIIKEVLQAGTGKIIPVDSEHSAIFQALQGEKLSDIASLILTASGGPFRNVPQADFSKITVEQALKHPNWNMGGKITIDSATMFNKALEFIEAYWLYGEDPEKIKVLVHPQSIVHSLVEFKDGTQMAQLSVPDMCGAIAYALNYPAGRLAGVMPKLDLAALSKLEFFELDSQKFPGVELAKFCLAQGGSASAIFNLANELAVEKFLNRELRFDQIFTFIEKSLELGKFPKLEISSIVEQLNEFKNILLNEINLGV